MSTVFWIRTLSLILSLGLLVFIHEFGHYMFSRFFKIKVEKFYLFFNPWVTLFAWNPKRKKVEVMRTDKGSLWQNKGIDQPADNGKPSWKDTEYGLGWLPLGGYCKIAGMIDESMDTEQMQQPEQPWEFRSKPAWQRLLVMIGGVFNNFVLAFIIYIGVVAFWGEEFLPFSNATAGISYSDTAKQAGFQDGDVPLLADGAPLKYFDTDQLAMAMAKEVKVLRGTDTVAIALPENFIFAVNKDLDENKTPFVWPNMPTYVKQTMPGMGAEKAALQKGDQLIAVNGEPTPGFTHFTQALSNNKNKTISLTLIRDGKTLDVQVEVNENGKIGFNAEDDFSKLFVTENHKYTLFQSIPRGIEIGWKQLVTYISAFKMVFSSEGAKSLGGFGSIANVFPEEWNWRGFWYITAFLSLILAFMNILPIPALDGGHVLFLLYEIIFRRKPGDKFMIYAQYVGMALLFALLIYANANDIYRFLLK